ncbi:unnamed protein product, partial [Iphiclides podalirius]
MEGQLLQTIMLTVVLENVRQQSPRCRIVLNHDNGSAHDAKRRDNESPPYSPYKDKLPKIRALKMRRVRKCRSRAP